MLLITPTAFHVVFAVYLNVFVANRFKDIKTNTAAFKKVDNNTK